MCRSSAAILPRRPSYANGHGVAQDHVEAVRLWRLAAAQGDAPAQSDLGICYNKGEGVAQDWSEAARLTLAGGEARQ